MQLYEDGHPDLAKASNDVLDGIRTVASLLDNGQLFISSTCTKLIEELPGYRWDDKASDRGVDKPIKENDDACLVAGTRITTPHGEKEIQDLKPGDHILMPDGEYPVLAAQMTNPNAQVRTIHLSNGETITGTLNHPILVNGEWVPLGDIKPGQELLSWQHQKSSSTEVSSSADTQNPATKHTADTSCQESETNNEESTTCTGKFGETITTVKKSQTATTSTTLTTITTTIGQKTYSWLKGRNMSDTTCGNGLTTLSIWQTISNFWTAFVHSRKSGTQAKRVESGIKNTLNPRSQKLLSNEPKNVNNAVVDTQLPSLPAETGSAPIIANRNGDASPVSITSKETALTVPLVSPSISIPRLDAVPVRVLRVSDGKTGQRVFNLTIGGKHQYVANGLITHNCDSLRYAIFSTRHQWSPYVQSVGVAA